MDRFSMSRLRIGGEVLPHAIVAAVLSMASICVVGAADAITVERSPDPRRIAAIAAALLGNPGGPVQFEGGGSVAAAVKLLDSPVPEAPDDLYLEFTANGNRTRYQEARSRIFTNLDVLSVAERKEGKGRFLPKIEEYLNAIASMRSWVLPAHDRDLGNFNGTDLTIDLVSSATARRLAQVLFAFKGGISPATERRVMDEMRRRVFDLYLADCDRARPRHWWFYCTSNWNAVCHAGVVCAALLAIRDRTERARIVEAAMRAQNAFLSGFTPDGYCSEGMGYWVYGFGHYLEMGLAIRAATGGKMDLFKEGGARARAAGGYPFVYQLQKGISPRFADGGGNPSRKYLAICRDIWPDVVVDVLPAHTAFDDAQVFFSRTVAGEGRPFGVAIKGGHNAEHHNHNDIGSWTLMLDGCEMAGDPGGEVYTARTFSKDRYVSKVLNSYGHPVPRVAGGLQPPGRKYRAKVLKKEFSESRDVVVLDISGAYEVKGLEKLVRTVEFDRAVRTFKVTDEVAFSSPAAFDVPIITYCDVEKGADPAHFTLVGGKAGKARASVAVVAEGGDWTLEDEKIENPGRRSPRRISATFKNPVSRAKVSFAISECRH